MVYALKNVRPFRFYWDYCACPTRAIPVAEVRSRAAVGKRGAVSPAVTPFAQAPDSPRFCGALTLRWPSIGPFVWGAHFPLPSRPSREMARSGIDPATALHVVSPETAPRPAPRGGSSWRPWPDQLPGEPGGSELVRAQQLGRCRLAAEHPNQFALADQRISTSDCSPYHLRHNCSVTQPPAVNSIALLHCDRLDLVCAQLAVPADSRRIVPAFRPSQVIQELLRHDARPAPGREPDQAEHQDRETRDPLDSEYPVRVGKSMTHTHPLPIA
jgi:hypothetical protein